MFISAITEHNPMQMTNDKAIQLATPPSAEHPEPVGDENPVEPGVNPPDAESGPAASVTAADNGKKQNFQAAADLPTRTGPMGIRYDFNDGCRLALPEGNWRVRLSDLDTGNIVYETRIVGGRINSSKRYFIRFRIEVWAEDEPVFTHDYSAADQDILVQLPVGTLGDTVGWFPYAARFQGVHGCRMSCAMAERLIPLFRDAYPEIDFISHEQVQADRFYATYRIGLFFDDEAGVNQPCDFRLVGLHRTAGYILGVDPAEIPPRIRLADDSRPLAERYVCIATQSTTQCKYWNNPYGWREIVSYLKAQGYRVICIDQKPVYGMDLVWNHIPYGAEDQTGDRPLLERARWLKHADFFIGLGSGLSWLAWAMDSPVVLISGFSHPTTEFDTPYRVINYHACNSCWNDVRLRFDHKDFLWCPRHKNTPRQFECTRLITAEAVKAVIKRIPGFVESQVNN
ncbi:MAG: autotransporter strand-loop-strand O-heptosyltransferase [Methylococcales bacterium]|nr:autotransporter strand-loop-strand O-heptosyltransferase [Methylococcales bacterium]